jgi:hypothetical protein
MAAEPQALLTPLGATPIDCGAQRLCWLMDGLRLAVQGAAAGNQQGSHQVQGQSPAMRQPNPWGVQLLLAAKPAAAATYCSSQLNVQFVLLSCILKQQLQGGAQLQQAMLGMITQRSGQQLPVPP